MGLGESERAVLTVSVTRSAGDDRAIVVFIDTNFEPDGKAPNGSDEGPGLRVLINDNEAYVGKAYDYGRHHEAKSVTFEVELKDIEYTGREVTS